MSRPSLLKEHMLAKACVVHTRKLTNALSRHHNLNLAAGEHDPAHEVDSGVHWEPYTARMRLANLHRLVSAFQLALLRGQLCLAINEGSRVAPVRWLWRTTNQWGDAVEVTPSIMGESDFVTQLGLMCDGEHTRPRMSVNSVWGLVASQFSMGHAAALPTHHILCLADVPPPTTMCPPSAGLREGHEPYRHLATHAMMAFLDTKSPHLVAAVPAVASALRLALQTYEPHLLGHALLMLQRCVPHTALAIDVATLVLCCTYTALNMLL